MQLVANHRLVEDFIDSLDVQEVQPSHDIEAEKKYHFAYIFEYSFSKQKVWDNPDKLYFMFQKIVRVLSSVRHIDELGPVVVKIEDGDYSRDEEEIIVDAQSFRVLIDRERRWHWTSSCRLMPIWFLTNDMSRNSTRYTNC